MADNHSELSAEGEAQSLTYKVNMGATLPW